MTQELTYGLGFRPVYYPQMVGGESKVADFFEIVTENFMHKGGRPLRFLSQLRERYPVVTHGVSLSIASPDPLDEVYLARLKEFIRWLRPKVVSDHLCWTGRAHHNAHDLLPVPLTEAMLNHVAARVREVQDRLDCRFYLENPSSYVAFAGDEMDEGTFLAELARRTGCGLLLDVNNLFVNTKNLAYDPVRYLDGLDPSSIGYVHLAGHTVNPDVRIDTHDAPVCPEVWDLYRDAVRRFPTVPTLIEWDDNFPEFGVLDAELEKVKETREAVLATSSGRGGRPSKSEPWRLCRHGGGSSQGTAPRHVATGIANQPPTNIQDTMLNMVIQPDSITDGDPRLPLFSEKVPVHRLRGVNVYNDAYFFRIRDTVLEELPTLMAFVAEDDVDPLLLGFLAAYPPNDPDIKYAWARLPRFIRNIDGAVNASVPNDALADIAALEWARYDVFDERDGDAPLALQDLVSRPEDQWAEAVVTFKPAVRQVSTSYDVWDAWGAVAAGETPSPPPLAATDYLVYRKDEEVLHERMTAAQGRLFRALQAGTPFEAACRTFAEGAAVDEEVVTAATMALAHWVGLGLVTKMV